MSNESPFDTLRVTRESRVFARYVLGHDATQRAIMLYERAVEELEGPFSDRDHAIARYAANHPWSIGALDGALALTQPASLLHQKLLLMAAILEAQPEHCDAFLPSTRSGWYGARVAASLAGAVFATLFGLVLVRAVR